eukprot:TRINITY_DN65521_c0_g1_i1.p1 TRINITY_DN65521_c0_g1~~TRINITY_DN65521_c0_g1_i1.p1  ORF type:complete len:467 (+),score=136.64 TRINITY_DN65521_c0_g1_i1:86-1486(+)
MAAAAAGEEIFRSPAASPRAHDAALLAAVEAGRRLRGQVDAGPADCEGCAKTRKGSEVVAQWYCADCCTALCEPCMECSHGVGGDLAQRFTGAPNVLRYHSIEEIRTDRGVEVLTPFATYLLLCALVWLLWTALEIQPGYFHQPNCPAHRFVGAVLRQAWSPAYASNRVKLGDLCDREDTYWKALTDAWTRTVVVGNDTPLLLLEQLPAVWLSSLGVIYGLIPLLSCVIAVVLTALSFLERCLPRPSPQERTVEGLFVLWLESQGRRLMPAAPPPPTVSRVRSAPHILDSLRYRCGRLAQRRYFAHFKKQVQRRLRSWAKRLLVLVIGVRVAGLYVPQLRGHLRELAARAGLGERLALHDNWFAHVAHDRRMDGLLLAGAEPLLGGRIDPWLPLVSGAVAIALSAWAFLKWVLPFLLRRRERAWRKKLDTPGVRRTRKRSYVLSGTLEAPGLVLTVGDTRKSIFTK